MRFLKSVFFFLLGGMGYVGIEYLWRGRSHISMFLAGGTCFLLLGKLRQLRLPPLLRGIAGAGVITTIELLAGFLFNRNYRVWDYRQLPANFMGHICLTYSLLWIPLSIGAMALYGFLDRKRSV